MTMPNSNTPLRKNKRRLKPRPKRLQVEQLESRQLLAVDLELIKDFNTSKNTDGGPYQEFLQVGSVAFYTGWREHKGWELWKTDGRPNSAVEVRDIAVGVASSQPQSFVDHNGVLYFTAWNPDTGRELWKSDGTRTGTVIVKDLTVGPDDTQIQSLTSAGDNVYFVTGQSGFSQNLYKSDGTASGTELLATFAKGIDSVAALNNRFYFKTTKSTGVELWQTNGTIAGTKVIKEIVSSYPSNNLSAQLTVSNSKLYFAAKTNQYGTQLWVSNGTTNGTRMLRRSGRPGFADPSHLVDVNGMLYYMTGSSSFFLSLWRTDGTDAGTSLVKQFDNGSNLYPRNFMAAGSKVFFLAWQEQFGYELWVSDGTANGTKMVKDINPIGGTNIGTSRKEYYGFKDKLYFVADDSVHGKEVWTSDGTEAGTFMLRDIREGRYNSVESSHAFFGSLNESLYFGANDGMGLDLWKTTGLPETTRVVQSISRSTASSYFFESVTIGNKTYFTRLKDPNIELWVTDGTSQGTVLLTTKNFYESGLQLQLIAVGEEVFFVGYSDRFRRQLWKTNGTVEGTVQITNIHLTNRVFEIQSMVVLDGKLYFTCLNESELGGEDLWRSDGTVEGTTVIKNFNYGNIRVFLRELTVSNNNLFFLANGPSGLELWSSDGTAENTNRVSSSPVGLHTVRGGSLVNLNGMVYLFNIVDHNNVRGFDLLKSDGTNDGTVVVKSVRSTRGGFTLRPIVVGDKLYFVGFDDIHGSELWTSDGTDAGTNFVKDISPGTNADGSPKHSKISQLRNVNGTLVFTATTSRHGTELWRSEGTADSTMVIDLSQGRRSSNPTALTVINGVLYFTATAGNRRGMWTSDGTRAGTVRITQSDGTGTPEVTMFIARSDSIIVAATSIRFGKELFRMTPASVSTQLPRKAIKTSTNETVKLQSTVAIRSNLKSQPTTSKNLDAAFAAISF
jgi:ELWxxDGT repeat protein